MPVRCTKNSKSSVCKQRAKDNAKTLAEAKHTFQKKLHNSDNPDIKKFVSLFAGIKKQVNGLNESIVKAMAKCKQKGLSSKECEKTSNKTLKRLTKYHALLSNVVDSIQELEESLEFWKSDEFEDRQIISAVNKFQRKFEKILQGIDKDGLDTPIITKINRLENGKLMQDLNKLLA